jgi:hypothetical protein|tara:strand:- start:239 stop:517 length:279 start_codon:yes stop_codon:yes gene_type:complete
MGFEEHVQESLQRLHTKVDGTQRQDELFRTSRDFVIDIINDSQTNELVQSQNRNQESEAIHQGKHIENVHVGSTQAAERGVGVIEHTSSVES